MSKTKTTYPQEYLDELKNSKGQCDLGRFTVIHNSRSNELSLGEIVAATGEGQVIDVTTLSPQRLSLLHSIAVVQTETKIRNEEDLEHLVNHVHQQTQPLINDFINKRLPSIENEIDFNVDQAMNRYKANTLESSNEVDRLIQETYVKVQNRIDKGLYTPGSLNPEETVDSVVSKIVSDKLYNTRMNEEIEQIVEYVVEQAIQNNEAVTISNNKGERENIPITRMPTHKGAARQTFMIAGPPACGKGSIEAMTKEKAQTMSIGYDEIVKINTDSYRKLISEGQILGPDVVRHAFYNNEEAAMVTDLTVARLNRKIDAGAAPHTLLDTVNLKQSKIDFGTKNGGSMDISVLTLDPSIALTRAEERGKKSGRFVPTSYMLSAHQRIGNDIAAALEHNIGAKLKISIYDNNVPIGFKPQLIQKIDCRTSTVEIGDLDKYGAIYGRKYINTNAHNASYIYDQNYRPDYSQIAAIKSLGYHTTIYQQANTGQIASKSTTEVSAQSKTASFESPASTINSFAYIAGAFTLMTCHTLGIKPPNFLKEMYQEPPKQIIPPHQPQSQSSLESKPYSEYLQQTTRQPATPYINMDQLAANYKFSSLTEKTKNSIVNLVKSGEIENLSSNQWKRITQDPEKFSLLLDSLEATIRLRERNMRPATEKDLFGPGVVKSSKTPKHNQNNQKVRR